MPNRHRVSGPKLLAAGLVVTVAAGAGLGFVVGFGRSTDVASADQADAHAVTVKFSALTHGKPVPAGSLPSPVLHFLNDAAPVVGLTLETASRRVHLLRKSMGSARLDIYAFTDRLGRPCFFVPTDGGMCATIPNASPPSFDWIIGKYRTGSLSYMIALVGTDVRAVKLSVAGNTIPVSLKHSVAFAQFRNSKAKSAAVTIRYSGGTTESASLALR